MDHIIGIIGAGHIGRGLAIHLVKTTFPVLIANSREPESLNELVASIGGSLKATGLQEIIAQADILFIAIPWSQLPELAGELKKYSGKIIVDATNNIVSFNPFVLADTAGKTTGEYVAALFPAQRVVKAFNTLAAAILTQPGSGDAGRTVIFISGDDSDAKREVASLIEVMSFEPIDIGTLKEGGKLQDAGGALSGIELIRIKN
ncbi:NADPH-dependent F420 reductase [Spirosoma sp. KUDC1026]|uniref:NADPH-dependent F420 reductase n=1 Tax=Spirosoma sp. KUDC1026 TaxID=2745947 RepID=UPI00159BC22F|nr:NAD(P)-binding domain-containing protein [Spirosoma sp. KUDC1026]QKZ15320.1 NAD(P)-binding domain-containing protein [Spirosoma sp. KUDC1026]